MDAHWVACSQQFLLLYILILAEAHLGSGRINLVLVRIGSCFLITEGADHVGLRWKMAVKVRMGEKELLQAMKQAVVMLMLDSQSPDDGDSSDEDDASPSDEEEEDSAGSDEDQEHGEPLDCLDISSAFSCVL